jgi:hypothetical protein
MDPMTIGVAIILIAGVIRHIREHRAQWMQKRDGWFCGHCGHCICKKCQAIYAGGRQCCACKAEWFSRDMPEPDVGEIVR